MNEIIKYDIPQLSIEEITKQGELFTKCGWFKDIKDAGQAAVKIMYGQEIGLNPIQSMQNIYVIISQGSPKIQIASVVIASKIKSSGKYDYRITITNDKECEIDFYELPDIKLGSYRYTYQDAARAGLTGKTNWKTNPRDMLYNRAISGGYKMFCPDIFNITVYTDADVFDEPKLNAEAKQSLDIINEAISYSAVSSDITAEYTEEKPVEIQVRTRPYIPIDLKTFINDSANNLNLVNIVSKKTLTITTLAIQHLTSRDDDLGHKLIQYLFGIKSKKELTEGQGRALIEWIKPFSLVTGKDENDKDIIEWFPDKLALQEFKFLLNALEEEPEEDSQLDNDDNLFL